jgi:RNA polymerase sigma-70 factor (ECF subfamily)
MTAELKSLERAALVKALQKVAQGDRSALQDVYRRTSAKLFGVCLRIFPEREEAEDTLQDVYILIWQKAGQFDPTRASPITWLVTIARNCAIDRIRARGKRVMTPIETIAELPDDRDDALTCLIETENEYRIVECLGILDGGDQNLIRTAFFEGATYADLAARAAAPLGTVKSRIRRALLRLRECLA